MSKNSNACVFCRIVSGELNSFPVAENELAIAFLDRSPVNQGHTLIIPRRHVVSFTDLTEQETAAVHDLIGKVGRALKLAMMDVKGLTLSAADGESAGQEVPHAHFHIIPRQDNDGFGWKRLGCVAEDEQQHVIAQMIRDSIG